MGKKSPLTKQDQPDLTVILKKGPNACIHSMQVKLNGKRLITTSSNDTIKCSKVPYTSPATVDVNVSGIGISEFDLDINGDIHKCETKRGHYAKTFDI